MALRVAGLIVLCGLFISAGASAVRAQSGPEKGDRELGLWTGGGYGVKGIESQTGTWTLGMRYGWVLTRARGPRLVRGRFEYAVDVVPIFWLFQRTNTAYGAAVNPLSLKWNFESHRRVVPYVETDGGTLLSNSPAPPGTSHFNFTTGIAMGFHVLEKKMNWSAEVRYQHLSNSGLAAVNPGINTLQLRLGIGIFSRGHHD